MHCDARAPLLAARRSRAGVMRAATSSFALAGLSALLVVFVMVYTWNQCSPSSSLSTAFGTRVSGIPLSGSAPFLSPMTMPRQTAAGPGSDHLTRWLPRKMAGNSGSDGRAGTTRALPEPLDQMRDEGDEPSSHGASRSSWSRIYNTPAHLLKSLFIESRINPREELKAELQVLLTNAGKSLSKLKTSIKHREDLIRELKSLNPSDLYMKEGQVEKGIRELNTALQTLTSEIDSVRSLATSLEEARVLAQLHAAQLSHNITVITSDIEKLRPLETQARLQNLEIARDHFPRHVLAMMRRKEAEKDTVPASPVMEWKIDNLRWRGPLVHDNRPKQLRANEDPTLSAPIPFVPSSSTSLKAEKAAGADEDEELPGGVDTEIRASQSDVVEELEAEQQLSKEKDVGEEMANPVEETEAEALAEKEEATSNAKTPDTGIVASEGEEMSELADLVAEEEGAEKEVKAEKKDKAEKEIVTAKASGEERETGEKSEESEVSEKSSEVTPADVLVTAEESAKGIVSEKEESGSEGDDGVNKKEKMMEVAAEKEEEKREEKEAMEEKEGLTREQLAELSNSVSQWLGRLKLPELKRECRERKLTVTGRKAQLVARLKQSIQQEILARNAATISGPKADLNTMPAEASRLEKDENMKKEASVAEKSPVEKKTENKVVASISPPKVEEAPEEGALAAKDEKNSKDKKDIELAEDATIVKAEVQQEETETENDVKKEVIDIVPTAVLEEPDEEEGLKKDNDDTDSKVEENAEAENVEREEEKDLPIKAEGDGEVSKQQAVAEEEEKMEAKGEVDPADKAMKEILGAISEDETNIKDENMDDAKEKADEKEAESTIKAEVNVAEATEEIVTELDGEKENLSENVEEKKAGGKDHVDTTVKAETEKEETAGKSILEDEESEEIELKEETELKGKKEEEETDALVVTSEADIKMQEEAAADKIILETPKMEEEHGVEETKKIEGKEEDEVLAGVQAAKAETEADEAVEKEIVELADAGTEEKGEERMDKENEKSKDEVMEKLDEKVVEIVAAEKPKAEESPDDQNSEEAIEEALREEEKQESEIVGELAAAAAARSSSEPAAPEEKKAVEASDALEKNDKVEEKLLQDDKKKEETDSSQVLLVAEKESADENQIEIVRHEDKENSKEKTRDSDEKANRVEEKHEKEASRMFVGAFSMDKVSAEDEEKVSKTAEEAKIAMDLAAKYVDESRADDNDEKLELTEEMILKAIEEELAAAEIEMGAALEEKVEEAEKKGKGKGKETKAEEEEEEIVKVLDKIATETPIMKEGGEKLPGDKDGRKEDESVEMAIEAAAVLTEGKMPSDSKSLKSSDDSEEKDFADDSFKAKAEKKEKKKDLKKKEKKAVKETKGFAVIEGKDETKAGKKKKKEKTETEEETRVDIKPAEIVAEAAIVAETSVKAQEATEKISSDTRSEPKAEIKVESTTEEPTPATTAPVVTAEVEQTAKEDDHDKNTKEEDTGVKDIVPEILAELVHLEEAKDKAEVKTPEKSEAAIKEKKEEKETEKNDAPEEMMSEILGEIVNLEPKADATEIKEPEKAEAAVKEMKKEEKVEKKEMQKPNEFEVVLTTEKEEAKETEPMGIEKEQAIVAESKPDAIIPEKIEEEKEAAKEDKKVVEKEENTIVAEGDSHEVEGKAEKKMEEEGEKESKASEITAEFMEQEKALEDGAESPTKELPEAEEEIKEKDEAKEEKEEASIVAESKPALVIPEKIEEEKETSEENEKVVEREEIVGEGDSHEVGGKAEKKEEEEGEKEPKASKITAEFIEQEKVVENGDTSPTEEVKAGEEIKEKDEAKEEEKEATIVAEASEKKEEANKKALEVISEHRTEEEEEENPVSTEKDSTKGKEEEREVDIQVTAEMPSAEKVDKPSREKTDAAKMEGSAKKGEKKENEGEKVQKEEEKEETLTVMAAVEPSTPVSDVVLDPIGVFMGKEAEKDEAESLGEVAASLSIAAAMRNAVPTSVEKVNYSKEELRMYQKSVIATVLAEERRKQERIMRLMMEAKEEVEKETNEPEIGKKQLQSTKELSTGVSKDAEVSAVPASGRKKRGGRLGSVLSKLFRRGGAKQTTEDARVQQTKDISGGDEGRDSGDSMRKMRVAASKAVSDGSDERLRSMLTLAHISSPRMRM